MIVNFVTPSKISHIDLISMGGSEKVGDDTKIGQFASGLKYAMALMIRNKVDFKVRVREEEYIIDQYTLVDEANPNKNKECLVIKELKSGKEYKTGFCVDLGLNWEPWMILRELFSNMKDESGFYLTDNISEVEGTVMTLDFDTTSSFYNIWNNRHLYINEKEPLFKVSNDLFAFDNDEKYLRIYKQGILVYEDKDKYSEYAWEILFGEIDERRLLNNVTGVIVKIADEISYSDNEEFLKTIVRKNPWVNDNDFLSDAITYGSISLVLKNLIYKVYEENEEVYTYSYLYNAAKESKDSVISGRKIKSVNDHIWNYYTPVTINESKKVIEEKSDEVTVKEQIEGLYDITIDCCIKSTSLTGSDVIADKYNKCILIGEDFDVKNEGHICKFIVQYVDLTDTGNL